MRAALERGEVLRFMTLTDGTGTLDLPDLYKAWNRLRSALKRAGVLREYAAVVETTAKGRLHLHVVATGEYIDQQWLSETALRCKFGSVVDIRQVESLDRVSWYLAEYLAKESASQEGMAALQAHAAERLRPLRRSRGWGMSMRAAEAEITARDLDFREITSERSASAYWVMVTQGDEGYRAWRGRDELSPCELTARIEEVSMGWQALGIQLRTAEREEVWRLEAIARAMPTAAPPKLSDAAKKALSHQGELALVGTEAIVPSAIPL